MDKPGFPNSEFQDDRLVWRRPVHGVTGPPSGVGSASISLGQVQGPAPLVLNLRLSDAALSGADAICMDLANHSPVPCLTGIAIHCDGAEGGSFFSGALEPLAAGAERQVLFPLEAMGKEGQPGDWALASALEVSFALPKGSDFIGELTLAVEGVHCLKRRLPLGPRLRESGLARVLRRPSAIGPADRGEQNRRHVTMAACNGPWIEPPLPTPLERPELLLDGMIMGRRTGCPPQWNGLPDHPHQWLHLLHRQHFLRPLVREFARTRRPALARTVALVITDWIKNNPVPLASGGGAGPAWETLSAAWRLREWLTVMAVMKPIPKFESIMLSSVWEHARHLMDHRGHATNWAMVEAAALALAGLELPAFKEAELWAQTGLERLAYEAGRQFWDDGVHFELSPLYQAICLEALLAVRRAILARGGAFPPELEKTLGLGLDYLRALRRPDGTWPALNDSWGIDGDYDALLALADREFQAQGLPPGNGIIFPRGGVCVLGSCPDTAHGNRLVLRAGPAGAAHAHDDTLSLDVCLAGRAFVVDPGVSSYDPDRRSEFYRSAQAHSMPWVDGWERSADRRPWPERIVWAHGDLVRAGLGGLETATAVAWGPWSDPAASCLIFRSVVSVMAEYFVVRDHFSGRGARRIRVNWQMAPGPVRLEPGGRGASRGNHEGNAGRIDLMTPEHGLGLAEGWVAVAGKDVPAARLVLDLQAELPLTLVWLLRPVSVQVGGLDLHEGREPGAVRLAVPLADGAVDELDLGAPRLGRLAPGCLRQGAVSLVRHRPGGAVLHRKLDG